MKALYVWSNTHHGRSTKPTAKTIRHNINTAKALLSLFVPGEKAYGYCDEDYGWVVPLTDEQVASIQKEYPLFLIEDEYLYLHNDEAQRNDEFIITVDGQPTAGLAVICEMPDYVQKAIKDAKPVNVDNLFDDWFENYGYYSE